MNFYNEFDEFKCEWIQNLVSAHQISDGKIDGRSITEVEAAELVGYDQCHFFCGISGWSKALQIAGYGDRKGIWTGSPPCQPFSVAGKRKGEKDSRHLWPEFRRLIAQRKPAIVFIEQVASKDGREWFARVRTDFEDLGYRVGAADLCGASIRAPHIRQRLYIGAVRMADARCFGDAGRGIGRNVDGTSSDVEGQARERERLRNATDDCGTNVRLADSQHDAGRSADVDEPGRRGPAETDASERGRSGGMADSQHTIRRPEHEIDTKGPAGSAPATGSWSDFRVIGCLDGKKRRVGTGIQPLAHGLPRSLGHLQPEIQRMAKGARSNRKGRLKGYGDAIIPELAALFVTEFMQAIEG